jgi:hypothetical protein
VKVKLIVFLGAARAMRLYMAPYDLTQINTVTYQRFECQTVLLEYLTVILT